MLVAAFILELYAALASNDASRVMALWSEDAAERLLVQVRLTGEFRAYCHSVRSFAVDDVQVDGDQAVVRVTAHVHREPRVQGRASDRVDLRTIWLTRTAQGWRVTKWRTEEQRVLDELLAVAGDEAALARVLAANAHWLDAPLIEEMALAYDDHVLLGLPFDRRIARTAMRIADALGDPVSRSLAIPRYVESTRVPDPARRPAAMALLQEAVVLAEQTDDIDAKAAAIAFLVIYALDADESSVEAEEYARWTLAHQDAIRSERTLDLARTNLGGLLFARQDYAASYAAFQDSIAAAWIPAAFASYYIGQIHERQNDPELALAYYRQALGRMGYTPTTVLTHLGIASAHRTIGNRAEARKHAEEAAQISRTAKRPGLIARSLVALAESVMLEGDADGAVALLREAITNAKSVAHLPPHFDALLTIGRIQLLQGRNDEALATAEEVLKMSNALDHPGYERYAALLLAGRARRALGEDPAALDAFEQAIARLEEVRGAVAGAERQQRLFFEPFSAAYVEVVDLLLKRDRVEEALIYAERAKGRVLLDALQNGRRGDTMSDADRARREMRVTALRQLNRRLLDARTRGDATPALEWEVRQAQTDLDTFENELAVRYAGAQRGGAPTIDAAGMRRLVTRDDVAYAEYVVHDRATYLFTLTHVAGGKPAIARHRIVVDRATLERRVTAFVRKLETRDLTWREDARALHDLLLAPAAAALRGVHAVGIVPDGVLWRLPFETLVANDGSFLVERAACFYAPSLSVLDAITSRPAARTTRHALLAFGNPSIGAETRSRVGSVYRGLELAPLPDAEDEVRGIERVYGTKESRVFVREAAVEERAKELMTEARVVHFATHGLLDDRNPMYSQLVLGHGPEEDGALQAWEMMRLDIGADLVVLSACDTARGRFGAGEGLIGMSWALFAGGCPSTVATLWKIASDSASELMVVFHQELSRGGKDAYAKAQALRQAQLRYIRNPKRRHPYYWSAFVLVGAPS